MSPRTPLVLAVIAVAVLIAPASAAATRPAQRLYVALGDSYAYGVGASAPSQNGYVALLFQTLSAPEPGRGGQLRNVAVPGATTSSILDGQLDEAVKAIDDPATDTRVVTLQIGGNDILDLPSCFDDPVACGLAERYATLLTRLRSALATDPGREALVVVIYPNPWSRTGLAFESVAADALVGADGDINCDRSGNDLGLNDVLGCVGARFGALTADLYPPTLGRGLELTHIAAGDVHLNDAGHALAAAVIAGVVRPGRRAAVGQTRRAT